MKTYYVYYKRTRDGLRIKLTLFNKAPKGWLPLCISVGRNITDAIDFLTIENRLIRLPISSLPAIHDITSHDP